MQRLRFEILSQFETEEERNLGSAEQHVIREKRIPAAGESEGQILDSEIDLFLLRNRAVILRSQPRETPENFPAQNF